MFPIEIGKSHNLAIAENSMEIGVSNVYNTVIITFDISPYIKTVSIRQC